MRPQDIVIDESYRLRDTPNYGYVKALQKLKPKQGENKHPYITIKCEHTVELNDKFGFIRYFRPCDLIKIKD